MSRPTDVRVKEASLYFLPLKFRVPIKFGAETVTTATCARVRLNVADGAGRTAEGWGETPLSAAWAWPGALPIETREMRMKEFCVELARRWPGFSVSGHPMEVGHAFTSRELGAMLKTFNSSRPANEAMPWLGALVCDSAFDVALHDAYGILHGVPTYETYTRQYMSDDLSVYLEPAEGTAISYAAKYPADFLTPRCERLPVWHLIGGKDPLDPSELTGAEPKDGYPVLLRDWIRSDGLKCLKIKLRGNDEKWDYDRTILVGKMAIEEGVDWLTADFNCTVKAPAYVNDILDRLKDNAPRIYGMLLYVEQPFPYDLEANRIDVHSVAARKPLFMDESAHDWHLIKLGRSLGWTGVALKTCKTQTGALLSLCWAKAHGMTLMVQDLTNPMLAIIPHALLAAHAGTIMGVEANAMQFYPEASKAEAAVHPGLYRRRQGVLDLSTLRGPGFGYRLSEIRRALPEAAV
jgi:L-alanine-DL-glutamate epimerase-like enolase superfamily enzyme